LDKVQKKIKAFNDSKVSKRRTRSKKNPDFNELSSGEIDEGLYLESDEDVNENKPNDGKMETEN
jgi:hypothetical protein